MRVIHGGASMQLGPKAAPASRKEFWLAKARHLLTDQGPSAVRDFATDLGAVEEPESVIPIMQLLADAGHTTDVLLALATVCRVHPTRLDMLEYFGKQVRSNIVSIGPPMANAQRPLSPSECSFISFVGPSYVRAFGTGTRFLPLFITIARYLTCLTPELAEVTRRRYLTNVERVDPTSLLLLTAGNPDAWRHAIDAAGTWSAVERGELPSHEAVIRTAAKYFFGIVDEILATGRHHVAIMCGLPMNNPDANRLIKIFNADLKEFAASRGVPTIDLTEELADPKTGCLRPELSAFEGDNHVTRELMTIVEAELSRHGILPKECLPFEWEYLLRFQLPETETRIWSEPYAGPENIIQSQKVMFSQIIGRALNVFVGALAVQPGSTAVIVNGREGYLACGIPLGISARTVSFNIGDVVAVMARRVANFVGRTDLTFQSVEKAVDSADHIDSCDVAFVTMHEWDDAEDCLAAVQKLISKVNRQIFVLAPPQFEDRLTALPGVTEVASLVLANRLTVGYWAGAQLIALST